LGPPSRSYSNSGERRERREDLRELDPADLAIPDVDGLEDGDVEASPNRGSRLQIRFEHLAVKSIVSAVLAVLLWPLVLFGVSLHLK